MENKKGKIIVIEGTDCSGKETQTKLLLKRLNKEGIVCEEFGFPVYGSASGDIVGDCYLGKSRRGQGGSWFGDADKVDPKVASLYYAADRRYWAPKIIEIINSGKNIILDRYYYSNMGHQGGKLESKEQRQKLFDWLETLELGLLELPKEDTTIFLYMPTEVAQQLKGGRDNSDSNNFDKLDSHETNPEHLKRAEQTYLELAERYGWIRINCAPDKTINSLKTVEQIHEELYEKVIEKIRTKTAIEDIEKRLMNFVKKRTHERNYEITPEHSYIHLTEEIGEVARQLSNKKMRPDLFDNENLKEEIVDVILESIILARVSGVNLSKDINKKIDKLFEKHGYEEGQD